MKHSLPTRKLPKRPDLDRLRRQASELLNAYLAGATDAIDEVNRFYRLADTATFALHDAYLVVARSYGFDSWPKLKACVDGVTVGRFIDTVKAADVDQVRAILKRRPELVNREAPSSHGYTALHYAVMGRMTEMVRALIRAGADPHTRTAGIYPLRDAANPLAIAVERGYDEIAAAIREEEMRREAGRPTADAASELKSALQAGDDGGSLAILERHPELARFEAQEAV